GLSVFLFIFVGCLGFPVFSGGKAGIVVLAGPTGGYLAGYLVAAVVAGLISRRRGKALPILGTVAAFLAILAIGVVRLKLLKNVDWDKALSIGVVPFLPGDAIKATLCAILAIRLGPFVDSLLGVPKADDAA
ncbi:MAG: biotin transporter BioY, partial [Spirochaetaceae bacterium]|nr:biotin transporter BioY [Spirochaetaceae bacterium]